MKKPKINAKYILLIIMLLAALLRITGLGQENVGIDESHTAYLHKQPFRVYLNSDQATPPLYFLIMRFWVRLFGISDISLRVPSAICGIIVVYLIYLLGKELLNEKAGLIAALILAIASWHIYFSQEALTYTLYSMLSLISMLYFIRYYKGEESLHKYFVSTVFLLYTHYFAFTQLLVQNIIQFFKKNNDKKWWKIQIFLLISYIPGFLLFLKDNKGVPHQMSPEFFLRIFYIFPHFSGGIILGFFYLTLIVISIRQGLSKEKRFLITWLVIPLMILFSVGLFRPRFNLRYVIFASFPFFLLVADFLEKQKKVIIWTALIIIVSLSLFSIIEDKVTYQKIRWHDIYDYAKEKKADTVVFDPGFLVYPYDYYSRDCFDSSHQYGCFPYKNLSPLWKNMPDPSLEKYDSFVYIISPPYANYGKNIASYNMTFNLTEKREYRSKHTLDAIKSVDVYYFKRKI